MTYWRLHYHIIFSTLDRQPILTAEREKVFYTIIYRKAKELELTIHAAGNVEDHAHLALSIPPKLAVADCVRHLKGASAHAINLMPGNVVKFEWQRGYGALSIGERSLQAVMEYAAKQKEHHRDGKLVSIYERCDDDEKSA